MSRLNDLYGKLRPGSPVTSEELAAMSVSADLAVHYVRAGWLTRLARGVFVRPDTPLELDSSLRLLERHLKGLHVGGKSALDWHGVRHNVAQQPKLQLYGWASRPQPCETNRLELLLVRGTQARVSPSPPDKGPLSPLAGQE